MSAVQNGTAILYSECVLGDHKFKDELDSPAFVVHVECFEC